MEDVVTYATGSKRHRLDDLRYDLISPVGLKRLARVCAEGAARYGEHNWRKGMPYSQMLNHAINHIVLYMMNDTSEDHLAHAAWNLIALMELEVTHIGMDDRYAIIASRDTT